MRPSDTEELLSQVPLFRELDQRDRSLLAGRAQRRRVRSKTVVVEQGSDGATVYAVLRGRLKVQRARGADTTLLDVLGPGQVFGEIALLTGGKRNASVIALEPCELLTIDRRDLSYLLEKRPHLALTLLENLASRVCRLNNVVEELGTLCLAPRLASRVRAFAEEHGTEVDGTVVVDLNLSQSDWADLAGVNREAVNRQFRAWEKDGWIRVQGRRLQIENLEALRALGDLAGIVSSP